MATHRLLDLVNLLEECVATHRGVVRSIARRLLGYVHEEALAKERESWEREVMPV